MKKILTFIFLPLVSGCATNRIVPPTDFVYEEIQTADFRLASWQKITKPLEPVHIYIEGDGNSFDYRGRPTKNPTPRGTFFREKAFSDTAPNVAYIARPCQFVNDYKCEEKFWTTARFAKPVIESAANAIKDIARGKPVRLFGFSGGAQVAGLVATNNPDINIEEITNYAPNLDHKTWTQQEKLLPLSDSMDLNDFQDKYLAIKQMNYLPENDSVIDPDITINFLKQDKTKYEIIPNKNHNF